MTTITPAEKELLTPAEREVVELRDLGWGWRPIALWLGIGVTTARDRYERAATRIHRNRKDRP